MLACLLMEPLHERTFNPLLQFATLNDSTQFESQEYRGKANRKKDALEARPVPDGCWRVEGWSNVEDCKLVVRGVHITTIIIINHVPAKEAEL